MSVKGALATKCTGTHLSAQSPRSTGTNQAQMFSGSTGVYSRQKADRSHRRSTSFVPTYMLSLRQCTATEAVRAREVGSASNRQCSTSEVVKKQRQSSEGHASSRDKEKGRWVGVFHTSACAARRSQLLAKNVLVAQKWHEERLRTDPQILSSSQH